MAPGSALPDAEIQADSLKSLQVLAVDELLGSRSGRTAETVAPAHAASDMLEDQHVHVDRDGELVVKWALDNQKAIKGGATRRILELIRELEAEGLL